MKPNPDIFCHDVQPPISITELLNHLLSLKSGIRYQPLALCGSDDIANGEIEGFGTDIRPVSGI